MYANLGLDEMRPNATARDLQPQALERHRIIVADNTVLLDTEHVMPLHARNRDESVAGFRSRNCEPSVVIGQEKPRR